MPKHIHFMLIALFLYRLVAKAASILQSRLLGDGSDWTGAVMTWSGLQRELAGRKPTARTANVAVGPMGRKRKGEEEENRVEKERGMERRGEEERSGDTCGESGTQPSERKRKWNQPNGEKGETKIIIVN